MNRTSRIGTFRRIASTILAAMVVACGFLVPAAPAQATSTQGGYITRSEVISRAIFWYNQRDSLTYNSSRDSSTFYPDPQGTMYAPDCSGYVSMAWHVALGQPNESAGGYNTWHLPDISTQISFDDLKPGDLINDLSHHAILFEAWESDHTHFSYYSFGSTPIKHVTHASHSDSSWSGHPVSEYMFWRYNKIIDDGNGPNGVVSGDVTGDGRADLIGRGPGGTLSLYTNGGSNTAPYNTGIQIGTGWQSFSWFLAGDVTGDGRADIVAMKPDGLLSLYTNGGSNTAPYNTGSQIGSAWQQFSHVTLADVTGDGRADLVAAKPDGTLLLYTNTGNNTAPYNTGIQIGTGWNTFTWILAGDVTGDRRADIVATKPDGMLLLYTNGGSNTAPYNTGAQIGSAWQQFNRIQLSDVTGDGRADLTATKPDGTLALYTNNGSNTAPYSTGTQIGTGWESFV